MGKMASISMKLKGFLWYPQILRSTDSIKKKYGGYRGINIRILNLVTVEVKGKNVEHYKDLFSVECYDKNLVRIKATEFQNGYITAGWKQDEMNELNARIREIMNKVYEFINIHSNLSKPLLMASIYGVHFAQTAKKRRSKYITVPVYKGAEQEKTIEVPTLEVQNLLQSVNINDIESVDDVYELIVNEQASKSVAEREKKEQAELEKLSVAERYRQGKWNRNNIFECLGYLRYGTKTNAAKKEVPVLASNRWHSDFRKFILFRQNATEPVSEKTKDFDAEWVHAYYRFIINQNSKKYARLPEPSPFKFNEQYVVDGEADTYGRNTFIDNIHKGMKRYIQELYENNLIKEDFSKKIDAQAFVDGTDYGEKIHFITVKEFLQIYKADLPKGSTLDKTRDAFIAMCIMGERKSDYKADKLIQTIDHFKLATFRQPKTGTLLNNVLLEPMRKLEKKYKGELPPITHTFNNDLRDLIKHIGITRVIQVPEKKVGIKTTYQQKELSEIISSKFGRSTYYLIGGVLGRSFEELRLMAGHKSINIAMKHYWELAKNYSEKDLQDLLNIYK